MWLTDFLWVFLCDHRSLGNWMVPVDGENPCTKCSVHCAVYRRPQNYPGVQRDILDSIAMNPYMEPSVNIV